MVDLLVRTRNTRTQTELSPDLRTSNVRGAFAIRPRWRDHLRGASVLLVDDVLTTGATVEECSRTLLNAGATSVDVLTLARVVRNTG